jgi:dihydroxy-acid dehydratase
MSVRRRGPARPLIGIANTWTEIGPCNFHLRARRAREGRHPRGRRHADGVQHDRRVRRHHDGHRGHARLARQPRGHRRLDRARRARHHLDGSSCLCACDKTIPARVMALARLERPGSRPLRRLDRPGLSTARRHRAGRVRGRRRARGRADDDAGASSCSRTTRAPGAGACGGQFTANTMAMVMRVPRHHADGQRAASRAADGEAKDVAAARRAAGDGCCFATSARDDLTRAAFENAIAASPPPAARPTPCCTCWRSPARRACRSRSTTSTRSAPHAAARRPQARRPFVAVDLHRAGGVRLLASAARGRPAERRRA